MSDMKRGLLKGALILTAAGFLSRIIGFFYRIFLSHAIGAEQIGIFQLASPLYALCFSLCAVGIHSILSRTISARFAEKKERAAFDSLVTGVILTLLLSLASAFFLFRFAGPISGALLGEPRCAPLLQLLSASLPFACVHSCISAYFYARKRTGIPSFSQLLEQCVRVGASVLFYSVCMEQGSSPSAALAAGGALAGELASCLFSMIAVSLEFTRHGYHLHIPSHPLSQAGSILLPSLPLTANHVLVTILHSTESILIPGRLEASGMSASAALSIYGVLTGMAIPMVLFLLPLLIPWRSCFFPAWLRIRPQAGGSASAAPSNPPYITALCWVFFSPVFLYVSETPSESCCFITGMQGLFCRRWLFYVRFST